MLYSYKDVTIKECKNINNILLENVPNFIPPDWFVYKKESTSITFGYCYDITFNGQKPVLHLTMDTSRTISAEMDGVPIDLESFYIPNKIHYSCVAISALFRCLKLIQPCEGYEIKERKQHSFSESAKCSKSMCNVNGTTKYILKHIDCMHCRPLKTGISSQMCKKCGQFVKVKRHQQSKSQTRDNPETLSKDEVLNSLKVLAPNLHENQLSLIESQITASNTKNKGMRWDKDIISMTLSLYNRNPAAYRDITVRKWLQLPSEQLLKIYKHAVQQKPGIVPDTMLWMTNEAKRQHLTPEGYYGGLLLDEMSIQEDLQIVHSKSGSELYGLSYSGEDIGQIQALNNNKIECQLANHVQQYLFSGLTGFRWPFANFPNNQAPPADIFTTTWMCIEELSKWGFIPLYCCMDGSSNNRAFIKMHFQNSDPLACKMVAKHYKNPSKKIVFIMDPSHVLKKIRNSVLSSGFLKSHQRLLTINSNVIIWKMWIDAYHWDQATNSFPIHHKLSDDHLFPSNSQKMKNKLAYEVLDSDMYNLMKQYSETLNTAGQTDMVGVLQFLKHTSFLVNLFSDFRPIKDICDVRIKSLSETYNWFKAWEDQHSTMNEPNKRYKSLLTMETREDLDFMYMGFISLLEICITELKTEVVPGRVNSDIIENIFCQERSLYHGANTNPSYNEYRTGINSIILGQTTTSKKSNTGGEVAEPFAFGLPPKRRKYEK